MDPDLLTEEVRGLIGAEVRAMLEAAFLGRVYKRDKGGRFAGGGSPADLHHEDAIRATFDFDDAATGMSARVAGIRRAPGGSTYVDIEVRDRSGRTVGGATRTIRPGDQAEVRHDGFHLEGQVRGQGFASRWNAQSEESYRAHGIKRISLYANEDVGGYAWARAGYDFADAGSRAAVASRARHYADKYGFSAEERAHVERLASDPHTTPLEWSTVGYKPGQRIWPGKRILYASQWEGVKEL